MPRLESVSASTEPILGRHDGGWTVGVLEGEDVPTWRAFHGLQCYGERVHKIGFAHSWCVHEAAVCMHQAGQGSGVRAVWRLCSGLLHRAVGVVLCGRNTLVALLKCAVCVCVVCWCFLYLMMRACACVPVVRRCVAVCVCVCMGLVWW